MSFFIKGKRANKTTKNSNSKKKGVKRKLEKSQAKSNNGDITSDDDEENENKTKSFVGPLSSEDENETAQEKKLRLAKIYLEEIEKQERAYLEEKETSGVTPNEDPISNRLRLDYLKQAGKLRLSVADKYAGADLKNIVILKCKEHRDSITCFRLSSDDKFVFSGSKDGTIVKWNLSEKKKIGKIPYMIKHLVSTSTDILGHSSSIMSIAVSSDDKFLAVGDQSKDIQIWSCNDLKHLGTLKGHRDSVTGLIFRQDTHTLYSCSKDRSVKVWSVDDMSYVETLYGHLDGITSIDSLTKERAITSGGRDNSIRLWKIAEESQLIYNGHTGSIDAVRLINEENFISSGDDGQLCVWSTLKKKPLCSVKIAHGTQSSNSEPFWITSVSSLFNTNLIASGSHNGTIKLWKLGQNFRTITELFTIEIEGFINDITFTNNGDYLIAGIGQEHRLGRWSVIKSAKNSLAIIPLFKNTS